MKPRVQLIHWNAAEATERAARLRAAGYEVSYRVPTPGSLRDLGRDPPKAVVIDLTRLPSHGREVALALRSTRATRHVPLIFVEGEEEKVVRIKELLPDAVYSRWEEIRVSLRKAIAHPPANPVIPRSRLEAYAGTPLPKKLGIKENSVVALVGAAPDFEKTLAPLPEGVKLRRQAGGRRDLTIWFARSRRVLERGMGRWAEKATEGGLWIAWPKQSSGVASDLTQQSVRRAALAAGLVDYKICSIDTTWSGLLFARRK